MSSDDLGNFVVLVICLSGPFFLCVSIVLFYVLISQSSKRRQLLESAKREIIEQRKAFEHEREMALAGIQTEREKFEEQKRQDAESLSALSDSLAAMNEDSVIEFRKKWFGEIADAVYTSELEVEIKFVYLFMRFLGYGIGEIKVRVPVESQFGRQRVTGIADWVAYSRQTKKPFLVIEAKEQNQRLESSAQEQARSYSFALNAPLYLLTNGKEITIFERMIDEDVCLMNVRVVDFPSKWSMIQAAIGQKN